MPKKILLIENDAAFAGAVSGALEGAGFGVRHAPDGKEGLDLAREWGPDGIVLCVELPGMSGYLVCQKLRKDDLLKAIPLVITSAEATQATFENHKKLKVRADEYLLKPYAPSALVDLLAGVIGLPEPDPAADLDIDAPVEDDAALELGAPADADEELVTLEEEVGLEALGGEAVGDLPSLDLQGLPDDSAAGGSSDEDLRLLDDAFDGLSAAPSEDDDPGAALDLALERERSVEEDELDAAAASLPDDAAPRDRLDRLGEEADALLGALGGPDLDPGPAFDDERPASRPTLRTGADVLRSAFGRPSVDPPARPAPAAPTPSPAASPATTRLERELSEAQAALAAAREAAAGRGAELDQLRDRVSSLTARAEEAEAEAGSLRGRADALSGELDTVRAEATEARGAAAATARRAAELEQRAGEAARRAAEAEAAMRRKEDELEAALAASARVETLERELEEARTEVLVARGEADGARGEVEKRTADLRRRLQELEAANAKNEERILKAYQKIKGDEKVREKLRKAIAIAGQLLDEGLPPEPVAAEKARAALAPLAPRE